MTPEDSIVRTYAVALAPKPMIFVGYLLIKSVGPSLLFGLQWSKEVVENKVEEVTPAFTSSSFLMLDQWNSIVA